ncbi:hypothetical protein HPB50_013322 [Hyalomma asiaticum]|uniref:Uncharacterized protein n=1 Tax=Hyalomma asiaticum TaxID=266040 RepID=A0ACB7TJN1_HYAAI|nr:hypothetical protein HPB50_013322 [Hyalomma asiaticum]
MRWLFSAMQPFKRRYRWPGDGSHAPAHCALINLQRPARCIGRPTSGSAASEHTCAELPARANNPELTSRVPGARNGGCRRAHTSSVRNSCSAYKQPSPPEAERCRAVTPSAGSSESRHALNGIAANCVTRLRPRHCRFR